MNLRSNHAQQYDRQDEYTDDGYKNNSNAAEGVNGVDYVGKVGVHGNDTEEF